MRVQNLAPPADEPIGDELTGVAPIAGAAAAVSPAPCWVWSQAWSGALSEIPLFQGLNEAELQRVQDQLNTRSFAVRTDLLSLEGRAGAVYILVSGTVKVCLRRPGNDEVMLSLLGRGEILGEMAAIDSMSHSATVRAVEETRVVWLPQNIFNDFLDEMPAMSRNLVKILARRVRRLTHQVEALASLDVTGRVASQLLSFAHDYGHETPGGDIQIPMRLRQADLAALTGACREQVNRAIIYFKRHEAVSVDSAYHITIHDREALVQRCR